MNSASQILSQICFHFKPSIFFEFIYGYQTVISVILIGYFIHFTPKKWEISLEKRIIQSHLIIKVVYILFIILIVAQFKSSEIQPFIYFQF